MVSCFAFILISMVFVSWFWFGFQSHLYTVLYSSLGQQFSAGGGLCQQFAGEGLNVQETRFCREFQSDSVQYGLH